MGEAAKSISEVGPIDPKQWDEFAANLHYSQGEYDEPESYARSLNVWRTWKQPKILVATACFICPLPRKFILTSSSSLGKAGLARPKSPDTWVRIIIEKPFGRDLASAKELNKTVLNVFEEKQVYRIDHYLGKDTVQNLLVLRFGNGIFEPLWNRNYVDHVQITAPKR